MTRTPFQSWAERWNIPPAAITELAALLGAPDTPAVSGGGSEQVAQTRVRLAVSKLGWRVWRNNVGAFKTDEGGFVRYGLANDSAGLNKQLKSSDLIGIRPVTIAPEMVGSTFGQFVALEMKRPGWRYTGSAREVAQMRFLGLVTSMGGLAKFVRGDQDVTDS